jgi:hypothetical protein
VENVSLSSISIGSDEGGEESWAVRGIPEKPSSYPEAWMFGRLPSSDLYVRHVDGIRIKDFELESIRPDYRPCWLEMTCQTSTWMELLPLPAEASMQ